MSLKRSLAIGAVALGLAGIVNEAEAAMMTFGDTNAVNNGVDLNSISGYVEIPFTVTNDDNGTEYSSATVNSTTAKAGDPNSGFQAIYNFGDNSTYSDVNDMLTSQTDGKNNAYISMDLNQDYVNSKWSMGFNSNGSIEIFKLGGIGIDTWIDNNPDNDNNTSKGYLAIGSWLFDGNGNVNDFTLDPNAASVGDSIPYIDENLIRNDAAVATTTTEFDTNARGNYLSLNQVVPEPATVTTVGLFGAALMLYRRFRDRNI